MNESWQQNGVKLFLNRLLTKKTVYSENMETYVFCIVMTVKNQ